MVLVGEIEVEEVPTDLARRLEGGVDGEIVAVGEGRELLGQHAHLDVAADVELTLHALVGGLQLRLEHAPFGHVQPHAEDLADLTRVVEDGLVP